MNPKVIAFAQAIAKAEGFGVAGALPTRCHNPGDLEVGDVGYGTDEDKTIFSEDQDGWMALEHQCDLMLTGNSHLYKPSMNILQVADCSTWCADVRRYGTGPNCDSDSGRIMFGCRLCRGSGISESAITVLRR